ncbi:proteasome alpha subunit, partial [Sesbania bispinosa]
MSNKQRLKTYVCDAVLREGRRRSGGEEGGGEGDELRGVGEKKEWEMICGGV